MSTKQEQFIQDLVQFYRNRGVNNAHAKQFITRLNGKVVNLSELYSYVLEYGGSYKVNQSNFWDEIYCKLFKVNHIGANFAVALRQIYNRYLLQYEKTNSGNFTSTTTTEQWNEDEDEENLYSNTNQHSNSLPPLSSRSQDLNNVTDSSGQVHNDSKLYCSLLSGLPNELNFAFNVATILSNCNRFDWTNDYKFINVLLESMKSYCCVCDHLEEDLSFGRDPFSDDDDELVHFKRFIYSSISSLSISNAKSLKLNGDISESSSLSGEAPLPSCPPKKEIEYIDRRCGCYRQFWYRMCLDEEALSFVFGEDEEYVDDDALAFTFKHMPAHLVKKIEQRIELIAGIILNISVTYDQNSRNKVAMLPLLKFLILLFRSENPSYLNLSLDILSNVAPSLSISSSRINQKSYYFLLDVLIRNVVQIATTSNNLHNTTKSFEILARYISCMNSDANHFLETYFENVKLYERITQLLTCQYDVALLLALLEFSLTLSETRPFLLVQSDNKVLIKILVNLLNCDASQHFTTGAFKKVKVVDDRPKQELVNSTLPNLIQSNAGLQISTGQIVKGVNAPILNTIAVSNVAQNVLDNESFAINWLRTTYEDSSSCSFKVTDIYAEYVKYCCRNSRKNVIAAQSFSFLIKRCFPSCNLNANQTIVEGLAVKGALVANAAELHQRQTTNCGQVVSQHPQLMSPILKAHLSTPPKNNAVPALANTPHTPSDSTQTSASTTNTSTLIKSLLANKLRNNQQTVSSPNPPSNSNSNKTVVTSQPLGNSTSTVVIANNDNSQQQKVLFSANPATTFAITPTSALTNNIIVPSGGIQQQAQPIPGTQQILVVRTILTGPGQQNPVRLILPASMITQQRLPAPVASTVNGLVTGNNVVQAIPAQTPLIQTQIAVPTSQIATNNLVVNSNNTQVAVATSQTVAATPRNAIATSSPLLNVLLDKGKLPDFPSQNPPAANPLPVSIANNVSNNVNNSTSAIAPVAQAANPQPKMYILTTAPTKPVPNSAATSNETTVIPTTAANPIVINNTASESKQAAGATTPVLVSTPLVNGDLKPIVTNNSLIKHALENCTSSEVTKRLKSTNVVVNSISENAVTDNGVDSTDHMHEIKQNGTVTEAVTSNGTSSPVAGSNPAVHAVVVQSASQVKPSNAPNSVVAATSSVVVPAAVAPKVEQPLDYECQWGDCQMKFSRPSEVFYHVHSFHIMTASCPNFMNCLWGGPEGKGPGCLSKRPKLSLLTHLQDFHCNTNILKQELMRKRQITLMGTTNIMLPQPPAHPGYAQNAAMLAIRRHANNYVESATAPSTIPISPLTVSIRLTSALILRNLAERSHMIKKSLELYEPQLCEVSIAEGRDESRTIAQCLAVITNQV